MLLIFYLYYHLVNQFRHFMHLITIYHPLNLFYILNQILFYELFYLKKDHFNFLYFNYFLITMLIH